MTQNTLKVGKLLADASDTIEGAMTTTQDSNQEKGNIKDISVRFKLLKCELDLVNAHLRVHREGPNWSHADDWQHEKKAYELLDRMQRMTLRAARLPSMSTIDIRSKAEIWLERWNPDRSDDVGCLAESICLDLLSSTFATA